MESYQRKSTRKDIVSSFYDQADEALRDGASLNDLINLTVREQIGRFKYTEEKDIKQEYENIHKEIARQIASAKGKGAA